MDDNIKKLHQALIDDGYDDVGTEQEFRDYVSDSKNVATLYNALSEAGYDNFKDQKSLETYLSGKAPVAQKPSTPQSSGQSVSSQKKEQAEYPQEVLDAFNSPDNMPGNFKDLAQLNDEYQRGVLKKPGIISQALGMFSNVDAGNIGKEQKVGGMITNMLLGDNMQQPQQPQAQQPAQKEASPESKEETPVAVPTGVVNNEGLMDAKFANYLENWKQRPDKQGTYFENMVADLLADGTANSNEEAVQIVQSALGRYANRSAMDVTNQVVASLPDDTVQDAEKSIEAQWYSHGVQDKLKQEADSMGISYDDYVAQFLKPAMVQSLVQKYGQNYRDIAEGIATRLYAHDEHVQDRLMNQDINEALSDVINKYVNPSVVDEYNKAQEAGSKAFTEGMEGSQYIPANLRLGTALGAQYEANEAKDPAKVLSGLQKKFGNLYRNPKFLNDMSNAAFKVMQRYGLNGTLSSDPKQFKPMINSVLKNELDQLEIKGMMPKGSAEYIMKTGLGNTIVGKITRKAMQTDYQNWLEDIANQQYQPGFWENVASGSLTFAGDAWSYWLPGAAGGKLTKSMLAKAEGRLAGDLMAKGMESRMAARAAKLLIGKSKSMALKSGAVHGAVTFGGQSAISKPIDEVYRTGQFDENGKVYNPSVGKILANTLDEVVKQSAVGAIMQGGTIANMVGKGRGLATNILADVGGKVVDSSIMTGQQMLERMAQDPSFKPTGKDAAESFLESMANLTSIGLPGMVGKYARFKDAKEFNRKFDFNDQDIQELKRFGYDGLRDAFEKMGIGKYAVVGDNAQRLDGQLTQKYMDLMNDKSVPEILKAKMMAVVEGKHPSSFSPVVDSEVYRGDDGKYYLETYNKDGGVIDRKEYSSHDAARKDEKKLEYEKTLGLASVLEGEFHNEFTQEHLEGLYNKAAQKYNMGEKLTDEDKAAVYLHQNAGAIKDIMDKQQKGIILTEEEQKQIDTYRHFYNSALENSSVMREFVNTFEDSHGVTRGTLRKALESKDKKYAPLVESYLKELYNSIELKREMKQTMDDLYNTAHGNEQKRIEQSDVEGEKPAAPVEGATPVDGSAGGQEPPVSEEPAPYQDRTNSVPSPSDAEVAANLANENPNESKVSDAFVMGQNAYKNGDKEGLKSIKYNTETAELRLKRTFGDDEAQMNVVVKAYEDGKDMEQFVAQRANYMTPAQQDAVRKYVEAMEANKGAMDALEHADDGYAESLKQQLSPYTMENGNIFSLTLTDGQRGYWKSKNDYGAGFGVFPDANGKPVVKQVYLSQVKEEGKEIPLQEYVNELVTQKHEATKKNFEAMFDATSLKPNDTVSLSINDKDQPTEAKIVSVNPDGTISFNIAGSKNITTVPVEQFNKFQHFAQRNGINAELDAEDAQRAENEAIKAEAEKKQRFANGIVGLSDQKPDYSSKETDTKVAAEYLQEQYADNHDQLIKLVNGSRSDIKEQIDNIRKRIVEVEDWLDTNADLEPEQAQSREDKLKLAKEQLDDLIIRYDNWNKIRSLIMTDEEKRDLKDERTANIKKVGINKEALTVTDEREVPVLTDEELKKQYPTMDEASDYILSQRKEISKTQEELHRQLQDIDARLNQYLSGETDLTDEEIRDFNTTKADLEARMANLSASAKDFKAQADKLKTLYVQENKKERAAILAEMTPAEQRKMKAEQYLKDGNIAGLTNLYADTSVDFTDSNPNTVDEYVASSIGRHALSFEGREVNGTFLNGLQQEIGGSRKDFEKIQVLAAEGKGQTFNKYVHDLYDNLPDNLRNQGVNTQEIRNSLIALLKGAEKYSDLKNYILNDKIAKAEGEMRSMDLAEEEQRAAYEEEKSQEKTSIQDNQIINDGDGGTDNMGNQLNSDGSIYTESVKSLEDIKDDEFEVPTRSVELPSIPQNVNDAIGANGKPVIIKKNIFEKNATNHPELDAADSRDILSNALYNPNLVGQTQPVKRPSYKVAVNTGDKNSIVVLDVYNDKKQVEIVGWRLINEKGLAKMQRQAEREGGQFLILSPNDGSAAALSALPLDLSSDGKDTNNSDNLQEKGKNFSEKLQNAIAETETEPTEAQKKAGNYKKGHLSFGGYDFTVETPKGVTRSGKDEQGKPWSVTMHDTYGYILGKIGVDGDHIDMFINDAADLDNFNGNVVVIDQVNPKTGEFDEHKVMYGYPDDAAAITAYAKNYSPGWKGLGKVTSVPKDTFDKWLESSDRKTKPFRDYAMIQHEEAKKAKEANEALPFDAPMNMDDLPFHRDVKEVKPSEMTEAQKVAYDAVSTMLKKAGIPVKVVSNEDMEKVAEAQDNLNLAMLLNQPEMRFKIKTPEEKQAAENAYNFAKELRPDKWKQYAVVDMSNPNKMPEYFEKQELARKERSYYNKLMWGNYKVFNLDKSFEDNVAGLTGSFPSEFDPYKIDAQTNKRNELKKQIKETEEAYKLTGQERKEYQNQLMKEYMDEHGLASENDIPDDVWREFDYKAVEKYQDKLDSLFAKYKDLDRQLKSVAEPGVQYLKGKGVVYGYTDGKEIVLNQDHLNANTPIHEYQHLWRTAAKEMNPELIEHGDKLIMQTQLFADLKEDPNYKHLSDDEICDEAFARLTGEDGAAILEQMAKDAIKENPLDTAKELTIINRLKNWLKKFWYWTLDTFTKWKPEDIKKMTLEDIRNLVLRDLANGVDPRNVKSRMTKEEAVSLRKQMADNAEQERILEHTEENWQKEFGKDSRVTTPIGSIKLGENQYKKAGRNDRIKRFGLLKPTLERPDVILEKSAPKEGAERQTKYLFIKSFKKADGNKILNYESITVKQGEEEVAISAHQIDPSKVLKELTESKVLWNRFRGDSNSLGENQGSALTPSANNPSGKDSVLNPHSDAKIRNNIETAKGNGGNLSVEDKIKAVSQQFGVDEADVAMYANAVKKGSTAEAARARANIKRHLLQANEDKISSFKELLKYTVPVNNALKENFGDLDTMIEERKQQVEAQRNAMEAARKRAEEEEAKRQKHLEELSLIPDDQLDKQYMDALAKGDDATAREMLDEAARRKGYDDTESAYQGVGAWAAPGNPGYESDKARRDDWESSGSDVNLEDMALGYTPQPDDYFSHPERYSQNTPHGLESVKAINTAIDAIKNGEKDVKVKVYRAVPTSVKEGKLRNGDWVTPSKKYAEMHGANRLEGKYRIIEDEVPANQLWWDGNDANEFGFDDGKEYKYKNAKNNRKLNDLVTYDDNGDVIPPSKRFNSRKSDIRFHRVTEPEELERLNKEKTFRMYSGMQEVDGKLYSPMAAIIDGKRTDATEIGAWMRADERPDLVKNGKFQLVKTDKNPGAGEGPVRAAYNPYMHTSTSMMNDQFTGAYARGNIKVVEWEIPESEKTSGYRAEGAKDAVGLVPWHSGSVNGLLPKDRQRSVMLSRWRKAVRVVPDSEVAESIAEQLEGTGLAIPWNVVTPNQLRELAKLGVPITTEESGQQAPETKEKFMAQMDELKKEFPQAQFVNVKMTKDAFKEWGGKNNVKLSLGDTVPFVREQRSINNAFNDALDKQIAGTLPKGYNYQLGKPSSALKFAGIEDLPIELSSRTLEVKSSKDYKSNHPFDLNSVKNLPVAIQRPVAIFDSEYEDGRKVILTELKDGKGHSIIAVLGLRKLRGRNYAEVNSIISLYGKDSSVRIANWFDSKNPNGLGLDKNLCRWADTKKASEWLTNNASNVHSVGLSLKRIAKVINSFENNQFSEENLLLKHNFGDILGNFEGIAIENMRKVADSVVNTANKLGGAEATVYSSLDDVPEEYRPEVEQGAKGWYDPETHTVHVYLPNCEDGNDAQRTVFHEKIGHEGMEVLLGGENEVRKFANFVYRSVGKDVRGKIIDFANKYDPDWKNPDRMNVGTQEYIARLAEESPKTSEDFTLWTKIKHYLIKVLKKLGIRVPGLLNDKDLRYYLMKAGKALHVWDNMPKEKQEAMMKQASNAEIKDSLGDGADLPSEEDNKPKKKTERGRIDEATGAFKLAPNGEQSNLSKKQYIEARTKNFKDWFGGDWEKKPKDFKNKLDANGEPLEKYVEGYLNRPKKPTMPKKRKGEDEATFFGRKMLYSQALEDWPKTEADWKKRIDEFDENTLAALTPPNEEAIREKYQKQYENDMDSWRKDHPNIEEGEERPQKIPDMRDYQSIQDYGEALGKHEIWKTAPNKDEYERMAEDEIISKVALMDAVQHPFSEYARLKAMKAEFQHMRHVMQNQKVYDQNTTDAVVQFAKRFMSLGYGDDLGRGSINTLLTIVKNSTGKKSHEISQHLYQVMDVLMNNQLRNFDRAVMKTMSIKELKENAKGIQVQGKLELRGQTTIKAFRDAVSSRISSDKLDEKISNLIDKMAADKKNASSYQDELLGLNLAKQYVDYIDSSRNDAIEIEDMKRMEIEGYKNRKGIYEGELTKALRQEHVERLNQYDEALFNNKVERMERYSQLLANLGGMIDESVKGAREFQERDVRRAIKVKMMASADLGDKSMNQHHKENWKTRLSNSDVVRFLGSPLGSFDALMREFGSKQINGEGQLWNHFVRGAMKASNDSFKSVREANNEIDLKVSELFGTVTEDKDGNKKGNMILNDLYALERSNKVKSLDVTIRDIEGEQTYKLQQGNLMYIYMVNKMPDGAMKLRQMGILDADVERIKENIDPRFLKLADWIQGEFLPKMRTKYNKRHEELFGAPMPTVENYFPLRVLKNARYMEEDVNNTSDGSNAMPSTATGAIIKRKINKLPLDILNADALSVTIDNINEMENWYNYAPIRKDANTLLSDTAFRNRVQNMTTIYGSGERLWNNVKDATAVAMGTYRPKGGTDLAVSLKNFGKGITGAKISGRLYTAFKQILSFPLFLADADLGRFVRHSVHPYGSFKWAIENMPNFDKRWSGRKLGDTVLMDDPTDWKLWHTNLMEKAAYYGMTPNALVDAVTCAVGARAVYDTKYKQYIKAGLTEERAKEKALSDAEINFNTSQQSSEGAFVSPMQLDRTLESAIFTPFRNSSMLYERKGINALRNLKHRFEKGHKEASIKYMAAQLMEEGVEYEQATKAAEKMYKKGLMHNIADAIVALWLGPIIWNLGGSLGYLIPYLGDDENKKKKMVIDAVILGLLEGPVDGLAGGQFINTAIANTITSDGISLKGLKNVDFSGMPMLSDFNSMIEKFGYDKVAGAQDLMFMVMQSATGFNPKTLTDAINACIDYGNGDMTNAKEIALFVFRLMNGPAATVDNLYIDELGMKGKDAKKLSYEELAKRYAEYKFGKNTFGLGKLYSDEEKQKKLKAIEKSFDKKVSERLAGMDREDLKNEFSESRSQKEKKLIGKIIADELETKDSEAVKKAKADASYLRQRNFSDLMDDLYLQKEWEATNEANAGLEELKGNGASEKEIEAYKTKHKAALDKRKAIQKARKKMQKKKADISSDNDEATMAAIRKLRDSILKTVRQKKK